MWRNPEIRRYAILAFGMEAAVTAAAFYHSPKAGLFCLAGAFVLCFFYWRLLKFRYRALAELTVALRKVAAGDYTLDVRDNEEGELSLLKSEIHKVTQGLARQSQMHQGDQKRLAEAIADISHQLKTPLTSMTMMADLLASDRLEEEQRLQFTSRMQSQLIRMDWLLSSLLKLSKIDAGTAAFQKEEVSVTDLVEQALEPVRIPMELKKQKLSVTGDAEATFTGDLNWTAEALINVLKNCVEHTPEQGAITICFGQNPLYTEISVEDDGEGIDPQDLPYIFKRFYKGKNSGPDSVGIGLAMAKSIARNQNGDLTAVSEMGKGSAFYFRFYHQIV